MYKQLPIVEVDLDNLLLDLDNYRIPTRAGDEEGALKYLFAFEEVLGAAKQILRDGYFDNEVPIVFAEGSTSGGSKYVVLEGNRRVAALKALNDPTIAPGHEREIAAMLKRYAIEAQNLPDRIRVLVAPDRTAALPHVARLHTGLSKKRWSRDQQATFYYSLLDDQTTIEDVKAQYPDVDVVRFIRMAVMRRFLASAPFTDHSLHQYAASDNLRMSSFEYAYRNKDIAAAIGVDFDRDGQLLPRKLSPEKIALALPEPKLKALEYLVSEFRADRLNTRSPEFKKKSPELQTLVYKLNRSDDGAFGSEVSASASSIEPDRFTSSGSTGDIQSNSATDGNDSPKSSAPRGPNHPDTRQTLDVSALNYDEAPMNLKYRYHELRSINIVRLPIAASILMRSVLEATIKAHFESLSRPVTGELKGVFRTVKETYGSMRLLRHIVNSIDSGGEDKPGSIQWFNQITHNGDLSPDANEVRQAWKLVNPILRHLLRPPTAEDSTSS